MHWCSNVCLLDGNKGSTGQDYSPTVSAAYFLNNVLQTLSLYNQGDCHKMWNIPDLHTLNSCSQGLEYGAMTTT